MDDVEISLSEDGRILVPLDWLKDQISALYATVEQIEVNARQQEEAFSPPPPPPPPIQRPQGPPRRAPRIPQRQAGPLQRPPMPPYAEQYQPPQGYAMSQEPFTPDLPEGLPQPPPRAAQNPPKSDDEELFGE